MVKYLVDGGVCKTLDTQGLCSSGRGEGIYRVQTHLLQTPGP